MKIEAVTLTSAQVASLLVFCVTIGASSAMWATRVTDQLADIQSELTEIKADLRALKAADNAHDKRIQRMEDTGCCKKLGQLWLPAIMPDERRRIRIPPPQPAVV